MPSPLAIAKFARQVAFYGKHAYGAYKAGSNLYKQNIGNKRQRMAKSPDGRVPRNSKIATAARRAGTRYTKSSALKAGGFIKKGRRIRKKGPLIDIAKKGVQSHYEITGNVAAVNTVFLGHCTHANSHLVETFAFALCKLISLRIGSVMNKPDQNVGAGASDSIQLQWKVDDDPGTSVTTYAYSCSPATTWTDVRNDMVTYFSTNFTATTVLLDAYYYPYLASLGLFRTNTYVRIRLSNAKFTFSCKSFLKMQNRTVDIVGEDNIDDIANVPLNGKSYEGTGTGSKYIAPTTGIAPFMGDRSSGLIKTTSTAQEFSEVPYDYAFPGAKRSGKVRFDPGIVKTSSLTDLKTMHYTKWFAKIFGNSVPVYPNRDVGKFRFFALERMIGGSAANIIVQYEVESRVGCMIHPAGSTMTTTQWLTYAG